MGTASLIIGSASLLWHVVKLVASVAGKPTTTDKFNGLPGLPGHPVLNAIDNTTGGQ